jgi:hypothetical protein
VFKLWLPCVHGLGQFVTTDLPLLCDSCQRVSHYGSITVVNRSPSRCSHWLRAACYSQCVWELDQQGRVDTRCVCQWCFTVSSIVCLSFHPMQKSMCMRSKAWLAGSCRMRVAAASSPAATCNCCKQDAALMSPARHACGCARPSRARLMLRSQKQLNFVQWVQNLGTLRYIMICVCVCVCLYRGTVVFGLV